jgi:hypothetical protein
MHAALTCMLLWKHRTVALLPGTAAAAVVQYIMAAEHKAADVQRVVADGMQAQTSSTHKVVASTNK